MIKKVLTTLRRRPFPLNLEALRSCRISYSQFGEDLFLSCLLGYERTDGVYLDVGCFRPIHFSNTYIFYQRGWRGVVIDPNPNWEPEWRKYRPADVFVNTAVGPSAGSMTYLMNRRYPACNRLLAEPPEKMSADESVITVPMIPINDIVKKHLTAPRVDFMNIDCEGYDLEILKTFDFGRWRPRVIAAEDSGVSTDSPLCAFLGPLGYECKAHIGLTKVFESTT